MKFHIYSIFDRKAKIYSEPFLAQNESVAKRKFFYLMSNATMVASDCELWYLGDFDNESGLITFDSISFVCDYNKEVSDNG